MPIVPLLLFGLCLLANPPSSAADERIEPLVWLAGTWLRTDLSEDRSGEERWWLDEDGNLTGLGTSRRGDTVVFQERLRIEVRDGQLHYVADVSGNPHPVYFRLTELDDDSFAFENPEHDFPQRIAYRRVGDELLAQVSAGERVIEFRFRRDHR